MLAATAAFVAGLAPAAETDSVFAVLTHKGGFAAGKAHDHLVAAGDPQVEVSFDADAPLETKFSLKAKVAELRVDEDPLRGQLYPRLEQLGLLDEPFAAVSDKQRADIRETMLSAKQLDAERFPDLSARLVEVSEEASKLGTVLTSTRISLRSGAT